ncbi:energy-coupling factor ABC transporter ATP-binding protein [Ferrimonas lipolytica]|uniref:ABC transporter ATP-binding protein n=1 Tax=Ferrimonas lipolytica TaxID=2724191 RepID=A0A6H1UKG3_9GAMM|nr:ABC transporter ATP-binding protein [Ferrimonas lipolytica]QIZ78716.1 ABC transporter ATP-binding protein [Ferrimonas lipolytica]
MLQLEPLRFSWPDCENDCLHLPKLTIKPGQHVGLVGDNGAGKSTLIKLIAGLLQPRRGHVLWQQQAIDKIPAQQRCGLIGILFQEPENQLLHSRVDNEVNLVMKQLGWPQSKIERHRSDILAQLELTQYAQCHPLDLDAGKRRMVTLASIAVAQPAILLLDEPSRDFDRHNLALLEQFLAEQRQRGTTIINISHDLEFVARNCDRVLHLQQGKITADGTPVQTLSHPALQACTELPSPSLWSLRHQLGLDRTNNHKD